MRILGLRCRDFMPYAELDLDLSASPMWAIVGDNGAGKSTLLDLVEWVISGTGRYGGRAHDKYIRDGAVSCMGEVLLEASDGRRVTVRREREFGKTSDSALTLSVEGEKRSSKAAIRQTQAEVEAIIGMDHDAMMAGPLQAQERAGAFAGAGPSKRKEILAGLLGLDQWDVWHDRAKALRDDAVARSRAAEGEVVRLDVAAREFGDRDLAAEAEAMAAIVVADEAERDAAAAQAADAAARLTSLARAAGNVSTTEAARDEALVGLEKARKELAEAEAVSAAPVPDEVPEPVLPYEVPEYDPAPLEAARDRLAAIGDEWRRATADRADAERLAKEAQAATLARDKAATVPCGAQGEYAACRFLTDVPTLEATNEARRAAGAAIRALREARTPEQVTKEGASIRLAVQAEEARMAEVGRARIARDAEAARIINAASLARHNRASAIALREGAEHRLAVLRESVGLYEREVAGHQGLLDEALKAAEGLAQATKDGEAAKVRLDAVVTVLEPHRKALASLRADAERLARVKADIGPARDRATAAAQESDDLAVMTRAFHRDGVPTYLLEMAVPAIERRANEVLERMPGGLRVALPLERGRGGVEELGVIVTRHGREREYEGLSVGQRFRVDLALRMGLTGALDKGMGFGTLWIDEGFAGQTKAAIPDVVDTIMAIADEVPLIVVVSHVDEVIERIPSRITVAMDDDGVSTAVAEAA